MNLDGAVDFTLEAGPEQAGLGPRTLVSAIHARLRADILNGRLTAYERLLIGPPPQQDWRASTPD